MDFERSQTRAENKWKALENITQPLVQIGLGTCGKAAGADGVYAAARQTFKEMNLLGRVMSVGCIGMCYQEPLMAVRKPGGPFIYYGNLAGPETREILISYLQEDDPLPARALCTRGPGTREGIPRFRTCR